MFAAVTDLRTPYDDLLVRAAEGDRSAFRQLYDEFSGYAYAMLRRQLGASPHVDDLLQQVFIKVYRELPEFRGEKPFRAWLRKACFFVVYDHLRRSRRHQTVPLNDEASPAEPASIAEQPQSCDGTPERALLQSEIRRNARRLLDRLTPEKRMALVMHDFEGHTLDEAAEILGCSRFTVRTRLVRARREFAALARKDRTMAILFERSGG
jgi:RNA polymerase sigma-70 factor (ECF subfamily)